MTYNKRPSIHKKVIEYFNKKLLQNGVLFLQETHLTLKYEVRWRYEFSAEFFFSHIAPQIHTEF